MFPSPDHSSPGVSAQLWTCRLCGQEHRAEPLGRGERAVCIRCGTMLAKRGWLGTDAAPAFTLAAALLAWPSLSLPLATVSKLRQEQAGHVFTGVRALWQDNMELLSIWVFLCGTLAPFVLLAALLLLQVPRRFRLFPSDRWLCRVAGIFEEWAMPEVHVLALLVAFSKLGSLVNVKVGTGFWCYAAMALMLLLAWRSFEYDPEPGGGLTFHRGANFPP